MGFYLRKSFRAGPVRLNLSKSGLGASVGVTGARVGATSQGRTYVHAGRGGVYAREYSSSGKRTSGRTSAASGPYSEPGVIEQDTGVTYASERAPFGPPRLQDRIVRKKARVGVYLLIPLVALAIAVLAGEQQNSVVTWTATAIALLLLVAWPVPMVRAALRNRRGKELGKLLRARFTSLVPLDDREHADLRQAVEDPKVSSSDREYFCKTSYLEALRSAVQDRSVTDTELAFLEQVERLCAMSAEFCVEARLEMFREVYLEAVADHDLTEEEEASLNHVQSALAVPEEAVSSEREILERLREIRAIRSGELPEIQPTKRLPKTEKCHYEAVGRLLKEKTLESFQREGQRYKVRGLVIYKEGTVLITSKRIVLVHEGTSSVPLGKILDLEVDYDRNLITIVKDGSTTPVYLTTPDALRAGAILAAATSM